MTLCPATDLPPRWALGALKPLGIYPIPDDLDLSVVIPVYNERITIHLILNKVRNVPIKKQIILFDDCSRDGTTELLREMQPTDLNLTDMEVCYEVFRREVIQAIDLKQNRFGFEPEVTAKVARFQVPPLDGRPACRFRIYEMPVFYDGRDYAEGKKIG